MKQLFRRAAPAAWMLASCAALSPAAAWADDSPFDPGGATTLDLGRYRTQFEFSAMTDEVHVGRFGVSFSEPVAEDVSFILHGGYLSLDVDGDPVTTPLGYSGRYLGLMGRYEGHRGDYLNFSTEVSYTWHDASGDGGANQRSELVWYETRFAAGPVVRLGRWRFMGGGYWRRLTGDETDGGTVERHLDFSQKASGGAYLGLAYYVEYNGSLALYATSGAERGVKLVFKREF